MPSASRSTTPVGIDLDVVEGRYAELDDHTVSFETFKQDLDVAPYFRGLPGDACTCLHLGYVTAGQITFRWPDRVAPASSAATSPTRTTRCGFFRPACRREARRHWRTPCSP